MAKFPLPIGAVTGTVQQMEYRLVPILHPLHAIGQRYFYFLFTTFGATNRCKASPGAARGEAKTSFFYGYRARLAALLTHSLWQNFLSLLVRLPRLGNGYNATH